MHNIHQAIAEGLAEELRPPPNTTLTACSLQNGDQTDWQVNLTQNAGSGWTVCHTKLYLRADSIELVHDRNRPGHATTITAHYQYEDPDLVERLQTALDNLVLPEDPVADMVENALLQGEPGYLRFTP